MPIFLAASPSLPSRSLTKAFVLSDFLQMILEMGHAFADDLIRGAYAVSQNRGGDQILRLDLEAFIGMLSSKYCSSLVWLTLAPAHVHPCDSRLSTKALTRLP